MSNFISLVGRVYAKGPENLGSIPGHVIPRLLKWYLIPPCLKRSNKRYESSVKWNNPGKGVAPSPTPRCSSYWKGSLPITLDYGRQLYFYLFKSSGMSQHKIAKHLMMDQFFVSKIQKRIKDWATIEATRFVLHSRLSTTRQYENMQNIRKKKKKTKIFLCSFWNGSGIYNAASRRLKNIWACKCL